MIFAVALWHKFESNEFIWFPSQPVCQFGKCTILPFTSFELLQVFPEIREVAVSATALFNGASKLNFMF